MPNARPATTPLPATEQADAPRVVVVRGPEVRVAGHEVVHVGHFEGCTAQ